MNCQGNLKKLTLSMYVKITDIYDAAYPLTKMLIFP